MCTFKTNAHPVQESALAWIRSIWVIMWESLKSSHLTAWWSACAFGSSADTLGEGGVWVPSRGVRAHFEGERAPCAYSYIFLSQCFCDAVSYGHQMKTSGKPIERATLAQGNLWCNVHITSQLYKNIQCHFCKFNFQYDVRFLTSTATYNISLPMLSFTCRGSARHPLQRPTL